MGMSIGSPTYRKSTYSDYINRPAHRMASGRRINSAADNSSMLAIAEKIRSLINGLDKGSDNSCDMKNMLKTADGGMATIADSLQRIRQLGLQAQNGVYSPLDKSLLQDEVDLLIEHIDYAASATRFNNKNLLDGSINNLHTASDAGAKGMNISIDSVSSTSLGISGLDITGYFDISQIDKALEKVSSARSSIGASMNRLDYTVDYTQRASVKQAEALSQILDTNYAKESTLFKTNRIMEQYRNFTMKNHMYSMGNFVNMLL